MPTAEPESMTPPPDKNSKPMFPKPSVLVVDDEKRIRDGCFKMLINEGHEVDCADSADVAMQMIKDKHFDIILLDLMMPGCRVWRRWSLFDPGIRIRW